MVVHYHNSVLLPRCQGVPHYAKPARRSKKAIPTGRPADGRGQLAEKQDHLYVNLSEIDDTDYQGSEEDKRLNRMFYKQERNPK